MHVRTSPGRRDVLLALATTGLLATGCEAPPSPAALTELVPAWTAASAVWPDLVQSRSDKPRPPKKPSKKIER